MGHRRTKGQRRLRRLVLLGTIITLVSAYRNRAIAADQRRISGTPAGPVGDPTSNGSVPAG